MEKTLKKTMADRLDHLMRVTPSLDTLQKIAAKSGVSYGTVRRIRNADPVDIGLSNYEDVAKCFGLSLIEFLGAPGGDLSLSSNEFVLLQKFRTLSEKDQNEVMFYVSSKSAINKVMEGRD